MMLTTTQVADDRVAHRSVETANQVEPCGARLAADVREALRTASYVPEDEVDVEVRDRVVYLSGMVKWQHQRVAAERAVEHLCGVHVLKNGIRVMPRVSASEIEAMIQAALSANGSAYAGHLLVDVDDESVILAGSVGSYTDRQIAESAARSVPQVRTVHNELRIVRP